MSEPISVEEAKQRVDAGEPVTFVDARDEEAWRASEWQIPHSRRMPADDIEAHLDEIPLGGLIVPYAANPGDASAVAQSLTTYGWTNVRPLLGGTDAWKHAGYPTEGKPSRRLSPAEASSNLMKAEGDAESN
jgi:rhodanese-related sulfurtransferase